MPDISWLGSPGAWVDAGSGALLLALAVFVATRRPRRRVNVAFAVFTAFWGLAFVAGNVVRVDGGVPPVLRLTFALFLWPALLALVYLALHFPSWLHRAERRLVVPAAGASAVVLVLVATGFALNASPLGVIPSVFILSWAAFQATVLGVLWLLALRFHYDLGRRRAAPSGHFVLMSGALVLDPALRAGFFLTEPGLQSQALAVLLVVLAALWLRNAWRAEGREARQARALAWLTLGLMLAGMGLHAAFGGGIQSQDAGQFGAARTVGVLVLAYAILRHQLLGIDVKVRWTISKTTVAAVFVAVFFVASEAAQQFFGEAIGSTYLGILAAGLLVFAIAPLSRLADRFAEKAVPADRALSPDWDGREEAFRAAVRLAIRGEITRSEEFELARIAEANGISHVRALELRKEVEDRAQKRGSK